MIRINFLFLADYKILPKISNIIEKTHYYSLNVSASLPYGVFFLSLAVETSC